MSYEVGSGGPIPTDDELKRDKIPSVDLAVNAIQSVRWAIGIPDDVGVSDIKKWLGSNRIPNNIIVICGFAFACDRSTRVALEQCFSDQFWQHTNGNGWEPA